jgi:hypothetical protein
MIAFAYCYDLLNEDTILSSIRASTGLWVERKQRKRTGGVFGCLVFFIPLVKYDDVIRGVWEKGLKFIKIIHGGRNSFLRDTNQIMGGGISGLLQEC